MGTGAVATVLFSNLDMQPQIACEKCESTENIHCHFVIEWRPLCAILVKKEESPHGFICLSEEVHSYGMVTRAFRSRWGAGDRSQRLSSIALFKEAGWCRGSGVLLLTLTSL